MRLFNSLSKRVEEFVPLEPGKVIIYICGLTPYDSAHIGHARTYVSFDVIKRYFIKKGLKVYHIQNITDVEDKIINRCKETGADPKRLTHQHHSEALALLEKLHVLPADVYPAVSSHIPDIIELVQMLLKRGAAYETKTGIYFSVAAFPNYGILSGQNIDEVRAGARVEVDESKRDPLDFALWKKTTGELIEFDSPWGSGRPGWHIECSAMARKYAGRTLDIHGGARDLIFPHHENEIAQSESATGQKFSNFWLHTGFLTVNGEKMSKSLGNFITLEQALSKSTPNVLRLFYLQAHYRSPLDYDSDLLESNEESIERIFNSVGLIRESVGSAVAAGTRTSADEEFRKKTNDLVALFYKNLESDLNTPEAIASLFSLLRVANSHLGAGKNVDRDQLAKILKDIEDMLWILGFEEQHAGANGGLETKSDALFALLDEFRAGNTGGHSSGDRTAKRIAPGSASAESVLNILIKMRDDARAAKDYKKSDLIRAKLGGIGIIIEDKPKAGGIRWKLA